MIVVITLTKMIVMTVEVVRANQTSSLALLIHLDTAGDFTLANWF